MEDQWVKGYSSKVKNNVFIASMNLQKVEDLMVGDTSPWNSSLVWNVFKRISTSNFLGTYIPQGHMILRIAFLRVGMMLIVLM